MQVSVDAVPFDTFVPISAAAQARHRVIGRYGALDVYVFDLYSIAVSKLDRGLDTENAQLSLSHITRSPPRGCPSPGTLYALPSSHAWRSRGNLACSIFD